MNYRDPKQLEQFLRERIAEQDERDKLDYKRDLTFDNEGKLNLVRLISAFANTYALEFDDYGFLIYGMNKDDGKVTTHVAEFANKGSDKLHAEIGDVLRQYVQPAIDFTVHCFNEPSIGTWGVIVINPNQSPPFFLLKRQPSMKTGNPSLSGAKANGVSAD